MKITLERLDDTFHFRAANETGNTVDLDSASNREGTPLGAGPMQLVVMALGGCSSIDIVSILRKARQRIDAFTVEIDAERAAGQTPSLFTTIHAHYALEGNLDVAKVRRAVRLSLEKYCSVARILEPTAQITYSFSVNGEPYEA